MTGSSVVRENALIGHPRLLRRIAAAQHVTDKFFQCSPKTLAKLAVVGGGPAFRKSGRWPLYAEADLNDWALAKIGPRVGSTSELRRLSAKPSASPGNALEVGCLSRPNPAADDVPI